MDNNLIFPLLFGVIFATAGGAILFSKRALDWMYKEGLWRIGSILNEKEEKRLRRITTGGGLFLVGILIIIGTILVLILFK